MYFLGWLKSLFGFFHNVLPKTQMNFLANLIPQRDMVKIKWKNPGSNSGHIESPL